MIRNQFARTYVRLLVPALALWLVLIFVVAAGRADAAGAPQPANGACTQGVTTHFRTIYRCLNKTWHCDHAVQGVQVNVVIRDAPKKVDAVHLDEGCTGSLRVRIETDSGDGIKLHTGAHDLKVYFGKPHPFDHGDTKPEQGGKVGILCTGKHGDVHQDGIQAMGGTHVRFIAPNIDCDSGNNGGLFCNGGKGGNGIPTDVVVDGGFVYEGNAAIHVGPDSKGCGAVGVTMKTDRTKASPPNCIRIDKAAQDPVDERNTCTTPK